jgi:hypothetical protein
MSDSPTMMFTAVYDKVDDALADLDVVGHLHEQNMVGSYDAAVIDKEDGKPHIVKRIDKPSYRVIPELVGRGTLPRKELKQAAQELMEGEAGLIVVGEPTLDDYFEKAVTRAAKTAKHTFDTNTDRLADELVGALKS